MERPHMGTHGLYGLIYNKKKIFFSVLSNMIHKDKQSPFIGKNRVARENCSRPPQKIHRPCHHHVAAPFSFQIITQLLPDLAVRPPKRENYAIFKPVNSALNANRRKTQKGVRT